MAKQRNSPLQHAIRQLESVGMHGDVLATVLAIIGAITAGSYSPTVVQKWATAYMNSGAGRDFYDTPQNILLWAPKMGKDFPRANLLHLNTAPYVPQINAALHGGGKANVGAAAQEDPSAAGSVQAGIGPTGLGSWTHDLAKILEALASGTFWIRAGEVVLGVALVLIVADKSVGSPGSGVKKLAKVMA